MTPTGPVDDLRQQWWEWCVKEAGGDMGLASRGLDAADLARMKSRSSNETAAAARAAISSARAAAREAKIVESWGIHRPAVAALPKDEFKPKEEAALRQLLTPDERVAGRWKATKAFMVLTDSRALIVKEPWAGVSKFGTSASYEYRTITGVDVMKSRNSLMFRILAPGVPNGVPDLTAAHLLPNILTSHPKHEYVAAH